MTKPLPRYETLEAVIPDPAPFDYPYVVVAGEGLPTMRLSLNGDHVYASAGYPSDKEAQEPATINGVGYFLSVSLARISDEWALSLDDNGRTSWYATNLSRVGSYGSRDGSPAADKHVRNVIVPALIEWLETNPEYNAAGLAHKQAGDIYRATERVNKARVELDEAEAELAEATERTIA